MAERFNICLPLPEYYSVFLMSLTPGVVGLSHFVRFLLRNLASLAALSLFPWRNCVGWACPAPRALPSAAKAGAARELCHPRAAQGSSRFFSATVVCCSGAPRDVTFTGIHCRMDGAGRSRRCDVEWRMTLDAPS